MAASGNPSDGGENTAAEGDLRRIPGLSENWTPSEQSVLENLLAQYSSENSAVQLYAKIAESLNDKSIRDVACRCRWMSCRRKVRRENDGSRDGINGVRVSSELLSGGGGGGGINLGGRTAKLIEINYMILDEIQRNLCDLRIDENVGLICECVGNINEVLESLPMEHKMRLPMIHQELITVIRPLIHHQSYLSSFNSS